MSERDTKAVIPVQIAFSFLLHRNIVIFVSKMVNATFKYRANPEFPVGGRGPVLGGCGPLMQVLFGENVCENERIGSRWGGGWRANPPMF